MEGSHEGDIVAALPELHRGVHDEALGAACGGGEVATRSVRVREPLRVRSEERFKEDKRAAPFAPHRAQGLGG